MVRVINNDTSTFATVFCIHQCDALWLYKFIIADGCGAEHPHFSGNVLIEEPDLGFVDQNSVYLSHNQLNTSVDKGESVGDAIFMGTAILDLAGREGRERFNETLCETGDVMIQNGDGQGVEEEGYDSGIDVSFISW